MWFFRGRDRMSHTTRRPLRKWPDVGRLEDRITPASLIVVGTDDAGDPPNGSLPAVRILDAATGAVQREFLAYDIGFHGGVRVATGDVNGDGTPDIITGAGVGGGPHVKVFDGVTGATIASFYAYDPNFAGGVYVAAGDVNDDGLADIITGAGPGGGPHVKVFDLAPPKEGRPNEGPPNEGLPSEGPLQKTVAQELTAREIRSFFAYSADFGGGVRVGAVDFGNEGHFEIVTGAGPGGGPHVKVFRALDNTVLGSFMATDPSYTGGVFVGAGRFGTVGPVVVTTFGSGPLVNVFLYNGHLLTSFHVAHPLAHPAGRTVAVRDVNGDGLGDIITGGGPGGAPRVIAYSGLDLSLLPSFDAFGSPFTGGIYVAA